MKKLFLPVFLGIMLISVSGLPDTACVKSSQRYDGVPKATSYIVTVFNNCEETRIVTVKIFDYKTQEVVKEAAFPLEIGETRTVTYNFEGERLFAYSIYNREEE